MYFLLGLAVGYLVFLGLGQRPMIDPSVDHLTHGSHPAHEQIDVDPNLPIPALSVVATPDTVSGYNLYLDTENYTFDPASVNQAPMPNTGHAHLYVNGEKVARLYGPWFQLDGHHMVPGENLVQVTLNANDHREWSNQGVTIEDVITLDYQLMN